MKNPRGIYPAVFSFFPIICRCAHPYFRNIKYFFKRGEQMFDFLPILWYNIAVGLLRKPTAILTASQKCSCEQAFLLHGGIAVKATPVYIRFVENNFAFSAARKKHKETFLFLYFSMTKRTQKDKLFSCFSWQKSISRFRQTECIQAHARIH